MELTELIVAARRETHTISGPFIDWDPVDSAALFLRTNRYTVAQKEQGPAPPNLEVEPPEADKDAEVPSPPEEIVLSCQLERGGKGRGWFSSNLAELETSVTLRLDGGVIVAEYVVDTTGQWMSQEEKGFWKREADALAAFLRGEQEIANLAEGETARATEVRHRLLTTGLWLAGVVFVVLFFAGIVLSRN